MTREYVYSTVPVHQMSRFAFEIRNCRLDRSIRQRQLFVLSRVGFMQFEVALHKGNVLVRMLWTND